MPHILPTLANEIIGEDTGDYYPVFYTAFARSAQSEETDQKRRFVIYKRDRSTAPLFYFMWLKAGCYFSLDNFSILCLWLNWFVQISGVFLSLFYKTNVSLHKIFTTASSSTFVHMGRYSQHKVKVSQTCFKKTGVLGFFSCVKLQDVSILSVCVLLLVSVTNAAFKWNSLRHVVSSCTGKAQRSSGNHVRAALLGNGNMDTKRSLVLLLAFYVET